MSGCPSSASPCSGGISGCPRSAPGCSSSASWCYGSVSGRPGSALILHESIQDLCSWRERWAPRRFRESFWAPGGSRPELLPNGMDRSGNLGVAPRAVSQSLTVHLGALAGHLGALAAHLGAMAAYLGALAAPLSSMKAYMTCAPGGNGGGQGTFEDPSGLPEGPAPSCRPTVWTDLVHLGAMRLGGPLLPNLRSAGSQLADGIQTPQRLTSFGKKHPPPYPPPL